MSKSSIVLDYFTFEKDNIIVKCGLCRIKLKNNKYSTSNLIRHLRSKNPTINLLNRNFKAIDTEEQVDDPAETASTSNVVSINILFKYNNYKFNIIYFN